MTKSSQLLSLVLWKYLSASDTTMRGLAQDAKVDPSQVHRMLHGKTRRPRVLQQVLAAVDNKASLAVSGHCGYRLDGVQVAMNGERRIELQRVAVTPDTFIRPRAEVRVTGLTFELRRQLAVGDQR